MNKIYTILLAGVFMLASCDKELVSSSQQDSFRLKGLNTALQTKASFAAGTQYHVFAYKNNNGSRNLANPNTEGVETDGYISLGGDHNTFGTDTLDFFAITQGTTEAPAITTTDNKPFVVYNRTDASTPLGDLSRGELKGQTSVNSGVLTIPFKHTLSRLVFSAIRQNSPETANAYVYKITVYDHMQGTFNLIDNTWSHDDTADHEITVYQAESGTIASNSETKVVPSFLVYPRSGDTDSLRIHIEVINPDNAFVENNKLITDITLPLHALTDNKDGQHLERGLEANYSYNFTIAVYNSDIKVVMVEPTMYEWIEHVDEGLEGLGQPISFSGVTWSDRNLGAQSNSYETTERWDKMRGYFYQFGRNIPYFTLPNMGTYSKGSSTVTNMPVELRPFPLVSSLSRADAETAIKDYKSKIGNSGDMKKIGQTVKNFTFKYPLGFWNQEGYTPQNNNQIGLPASLESYDPKKTGLAIYPDEWEKAYPGKTWSEIPQDEKDRYLFGQGSFYDYQPWWNGVHSSSAYSGTTPTTWNTPETDPCPKGWRVPTKDDWAYIMPLSKRTGDITFLNGALNTANTNNIITELNNHIKTATGLAKEDYEKYLADISKNNVGIGPNNQEIRHHAGLLSWYERGGNITINLSIIEEAPGDPVAGFHTDYFCIRNNTSELGTLYAVKCQGTSSAYRVRWRYITLKNGYSPVGNDNTIYPTVLEICRYPAQLDTEMKRKEDVDAWDDWDHPSERMVFPVGGYIYPEGSPRLTNIATESLYACSTIVEEGSNKDWFYYVRVKPGGSNGTKYLMLFKMRRAYGMSVRCVRDNQVSID